MQSGSAAGAMIGLNPGYRPINAANTGPQRNILDALGAIA
jgi:hypothetical protein